MLGHKLTQAERQPLHELAAAQGIEMADVQAALKDAYQTAIDQAVSDDILTQEEADQLSERFERFGQGDGPGPRRSPRGKHGGFRGFRGFDKPPAAADSL